MIDPLLDDERLLVAAFLEMGREALTIAADILDLDWISSHARSILRPPVPEWPRSLISIFRGGTSVDWTRPSSPWRFFLKMLNDFLREYATPVRSAAGFKKKAVAYRYATETGDLVFVTFSTTQIAPEACFRLQRSHPLNRAACETDCLQIGPSSLHTPSHCV